eukprot:4515927-Amphidinium_carterae.1
MVTLWCISATESPQVHRELHRMRRRECVLGLDRLDTGCNTASIYSIDSVGVTGNSRFNMWRTCFTVTPTQEIGHATILISAQALNIDEKILTAIKMSRSGFFASKKIDTRQGGSGRGQSRPVNTELVRDLNQVFTRFGDGKAMIEEH